MGIDTDDGTNVPAADRYDRQVAAWEHERTTTIVLEQCEDGTWHATQRGVDVHGRGDSAAAAAAAYCTRVDGGD